MNRTAILTGACVIAAGAALTAIITPNPAPPPAPAPTYSQADKDAFGARVRDYLLTNPEVIFEAADVMQKRQQEQQNANDATLIDQNAKALFDDGHSWVGGNPEGDVTLVEFFDYRCGYCRRAFPEVEELVKSDGNIRLIIKEFPILGDQSVVASRFAIATQQVLGNDAYKAVHDALMTYKGDMALPGLKRLAEALDLDPAPVVAHMDSDEVSKVIAANRALGDTLNISGTPTFVVQDEMLRGYAPLEDMRGIVADIRS